MKLPETLLSALGRVLKSEFDLTWEDSRPLAKAVLRMSDFYAQNPGAPTPWNEDWCAISQLAYYGPLNWIRVQALRSRLNWGLYQNTIAPQHWLDWGSGLGVGTWLTPENLPVLNIETSARAQKLHQLILENLPHQNQHRWNSTLPALEPKTFALLSYSLVEHRPLPAWLEQTSGFVILEPSTQDQSRRLMELRQQWIDSGWKIWAPCTHQQECPLLKSAHIDWCHDRIAFEAPAAWLKMEEHLPMRNRTITFSYLVVAQASPPSTQGLARLTGDIKHENGKSRQLVCRGPTREFLAWMHRHGEAPEMPRGSLIRWPAKFELKSNEIRVQDSIDIISPADDN